MRSHPLSMQHRQLVFRGLFWAMKGHAQQFLRNVLLASLAVWGLCQCVEETGADEQKTASVLYVPQPDDFRNAYDADPANKQRQSWDDYYRWVKAFYRGNLLASGWTSQAERVVRKLEDRRVRAEMIDILNPLGRQISEEWSKDNAIRRINSDDLAAFGRRLRQAVNDDNGSGSTIRAALDAMQEIVGERLKKPSLTDSM